MYQSFFLTYFLYSGTNTIMPDATMVKITMKSIFAALVSNIQHNPTHRSRMHTNLIKLPVVIAFYLLCLITCKGNVFFLFNHHIS